jgi:hypothetical protein
MPSSNDWGFGKAFVYSRDRVYVTAHLPLLEAQGVHITQVLRWTGEWGSYRVETPVVGITGTDTPELTILCMAPTGEVHVAVSSGTSTEHVDAGPEGPGESGVLRDIRRIGDDIFVTGMARQVYRRSAPGRWVREDLGVRVKQPTEGIVGFNSIDGFGTDEIYAAGWNGEIWRRVSNKWMPCNSPTNVKLERVLCTKQGDVYACGQVGTVIRGRGDHWEIVEQDVTDNGFWGIESFAGEIWIATNDELFHLTEQGEFEPVDFGVDDEDVTCGWLHANDGMLWSVGGEHLFSTVDGKKWKLHYLPSS